MDGIETKIAKDMIKPASGFVDALLAPKIKRVGSWAKDRELSKYMKDDRLLQLLRTYLQRTAQKASYLSTIVFTQDKVPLQSVYEPLTCVEKGNIYESSGGDTVNLDLEGEGLCYLIIDDAGMGKSTYAKYICIRIISETDKIPVLFELSQYNGKFSLLDSIAEQFDEIGNPLDRDLFTKLLVTGRIFIILDGFDEVSNEHQDSLRSELQEINERKRDASLLITSRPKERLPTLIDSRSLTIRRLSKNQSISIFKKYDSYSGLSIGEKLEAEIEKIPERFLETPLLVGLLYRTFGFNNSIANKISVFYSELYDALYKGHDLTKSGYVREKLSKLDVDNFRELLRALSFLFVAKKNDEMYTLESFVDLAEESQKLCTFESISARDYIDDLLLAVPILVRDGNNYKFIHRSIAEYFAAEFIERSENKKAILEHILSTDNREGFSETLEYLYEIDPTSYRESISLPIAEDYLREYSSSIYSPLYSTLKFTKELSISYWRLSREKKLWKMVDRILTYQAREYCVVVGTTFTAQLKGLSMWP